MSFEYEVLPELQEVVYEPIVFTLSRRQVARFEAWKAGFSYGYNVCGGDFSFHFTPTTIGTVVYAVYGKTGAQLDLTEDM